MVGSLVLNHDRFVKRRSERQASATGDEVRDARGPDPERKRVRTSVGAGIRVEPEGDEEECEGELVEHGGAFVC